MELSVGFDEVEGSGDEGSDDGGEGGGEGVQEDGMVLAGRPQDALGGLVGRDKHPRKRPVSHHRRHVAPPQSPHPPRPHYRLERLPDTPVVV